MSQMIEQRAFGSLHSYSFPREDTRRVLIHSRHARMLSLDVTMCCRVLQCVAVRCSVLQCVAVCCSALQCVAVCCSARLSTDLHLSCVYLRV